MIIRDRVYGRYDIQEKVLIELIKSAPLQRLKKINQAGASKYLFPQRNISRFEHCVGVMLLIRRYKGTLTEQVAGLLHDVPHTAFSHVADFVFEDKNHEFHELFHESIIEKSEIAKIIKKYKIPNTVIHPENFSLLERPLPDLCADRIDYALRDFMLLKNNLKRVKKKLDGLTVYKSEFVFKDLLAAKTFAFDYLEQDRTVWAHPREVAAYAILAEAIRHALDIKILTIDDLFTDDDRVMKILIAKEDPYVKDKLAYLIPAFRIEPASKDHHDIYVKTKNRFVDPKVVTNGKWQRLSQLSSDFKEVLLAHKKYGQNGWYLNIFIS